MFQSLQHKFQSLQHKFQSLEYKFQTLKHKIALEENTFSLGEMKNNIRRKKKKGGVVYNQNKRLYIDVYSPRMMPANPQSRMMRIGPMR